MKNYYHILGLTLESNPSDELITSCYKALVKIFHPDVFRGDKKLGKQKIRDLNEAYEILKDKKKKKKYDEELKAFINQEKTTDEDVQRQESEYENYDNFDAKEFEKDWEVVLEVYPEIEEMREYLTKVNTQLSFQFQVILINTKKYDLAKEIKDTLLNSFLTIHYGKHSLIRELAEKMFIHNNDEMAIELSRYISIIGDNSPRKLLDAFFKKFPDAHHIYGNDIANYGEALEFSSDWGKSNNYSEPKKKKFFRFSNPILIVLVIIVLAAIFS